MKLVIDRVSLKTDYPMNWSRYHNDDQGRNSKNDTIFLLLPSWMSLHA